MRIPGAGGAWTLISPNVDLTYGKDLNQLQTLEVKLPLLSAADEVLVVEGNDVRALVGGSEKWYGQIRKAEEAPYRRVWSVKAFGKEVRAHDRAWTSRRTFTNLPPEVIADEILGNVMDEELQGGLVVHLDGETLTTDGLALEDLSGNGNIATFTPAGSTTSRIGKWGLAREFDGVNDYLDFTDKVAFEPASRFTWVFHLNITSSGSDDILDKLVGSSNDGYIVRITSAGVIQVLLGNGTTTTTLSSVTNTYPYDGEWHDLVVRWDDSDDIVFVELDGISENIGTFAGPLAHNTKSLRIGGQWFGNHIDGGIDLFLFYNDRRLSLAQSRAAAGRSIYEGGLLADAFDPISFRAEEDDRLSIVDEIAKTVGAEWFSDRDADDRDRFRLVARRGSVTPTDTFQLGRTIVPPGPDRDQDRETVVNDVIALGYGDGVNQLRSRIWHATTIRQPLAVKLLAADTVIDVGSATTYPASGVVKLGMERILYTGKTASTLTGLTHAYTADGYDSLAAYDHSKGISVWLHVDTAATPDATFDPSNPQTGSSILDNTHRQGPPKVDRGIIDQDTLDFLAQRLLDTYKDPRDSLWANVREDSIVAEVGDDVTVLDLTGAALFTSPYRLFAYKFTRTGSLWALELGSPRDVAEAELARIREELRLSRSYGQGATNLFTQDLAENIIGGTFGADGVKTALFDLSVPVEAVFLNKVRVVRLRMRPFEAFKVEDLGTGADGDVTVSTSIQLLSNKNYNTLTVTGTGIIEMAGFTIKVRGAAVIDGIIRSNGGNAVGRIGGNGGVGNRGGKGGNGDTARVGPSNGFSGVDGIDGSSDGAGGNSGVGGDTTGFTGGAASTGGAGTGGAKIGASGGGGAAGAAEAASTSGEGGGGGGGAGDVFFSCDSLAGTGSFEAIGGTAGNGGNGTGAEAGGGAGGGSGAGGTIDLFVDVSTFTGTLTVAGGTVGTGGTGIGGGGNGTNGLAGGAGRLTQKPVSRIELIPYVSPSVRLFVDGVDKTALAKPPGPYTVDVSDIDLIDTIDWLPPAVHTVEFNETAAPKRGRIQALLATQVFIRSSL